MPRHARLTAIALALAAAPAMAEQVACHYRYGGEEHVLVVRPVASPYAVPAIAVGSYFRFRAVFQTQPADLASIKVYTYGDHDDTPVIIHQASFDYPPPPAGRYGFTGLQFVYEPLRDGELQYWCRMAPDSEVSR